MERKLAAILAADVVGYSRLMEADEKGAHARLKALRIDFIEPEIAEHRGRVVKLMGDGALVEFASIVDAVECAAAVQQGIAEREAAEPEDRRIALRIGINLGDVIIDGDCRIERRGSMCCHTLLRHFMSALERKTRRSKHRGGDYDERAGSHEMFWLNVFPVFDGLHSDLRFIELLRKIGVEPE